MQTPRRNVMKGAAALGLSAVLPRSAHSQGAAPAGDFGTVFDEVRTSLLANFAGTGHREIAPAPMVTGTQDFNGGLRYDESDLTVAAGQMVIQPCARTSDIAERYRPDVLSYFHIFASSRLPGTTVTEVFQQALRYLTGTLNLDPARMAFVSIPRFEELRPVLQRDGFDWPRQTFLRDPVLAHAAGDGSGYFRVPRDRAMTTLATVGLYYWIGGAGMDETISYPASPNWTEIGEVGLDDEADFAIGMGVERLVLAANGAFPTWDQGVSELVEHVMREVGPNAPPPGLRLFAEL